jgi:hypothetical protein
MTDDNDFLDFIESNLGQIERILDKLFTDEELQDLGFKEKMKILENLPPMEITEDGKRIFGACSENSQ